MVLKSPYTNKTEVRSYRRNSTHRCIALFNNKAAGPVRDNIGYVQGSFLELDGSTDGTLKTRGDIFTYCKLLKQPKPSYVIETSPGHFHVLWIYYDPLPWNEKNESYWLSQQKRLMELFKQGGFLVDEGASLNPVQNLRNYSQLNAYNYKRRCNVTIDKTHNKTSLRAIYRALNGTNIPNPNNKPKASTKLRRFLRANKTFTMTLKEIAEALGVSTRTVKTEVDRAIRNGDMFVVGRVGNNRGVKRATTYKSGIYLEKIPEVQSSSSKTIISENNELLKSFKANGAEQGERNRALFACGLYLKYLKGGEISFRELLSELGEGARRSKLPELEIRRTLRNVLKDNYEYPLGQSKLESWGLLQSTRESRGHLH